MSKQLDFWPERLGRSSVAFARLAFCAAVAPRPQRSEDAGASASAVNSNVLNARGACNENYKGRNCMLVTAAPLGNHGENNNGGLL